MPASGYVARMWTPSGERVFGPGWIETEEYAVRTSHVEFELDDRGVPEARVRFSVPNDHRLTTDLNHGGAFRVFLYDDPAMLMAEGWSNGVSSKTTSGGFRQGRVSECELLVRRVSRLSIALNASPRAGVHYEFRVLPRLGAFQSTRLTSGVSSVGPMSLTPDRSPAYARCGVTDLRMEVTYEDPDRRRTNQDTGVLSVVEQHVVALHRDADPVHDVQEELRDLARTGEVVVALLSCWYRRNVRIVGATSQRPGRDHDDLGRAQTLFVRSGGEDASVHSEADDEIFDLVQRVVSDWSDSADLLHPLQLVAASFDTFAEGAFLARYVALEQIVAHWFLCRGGRDRAYAEQQSAGPLWPRNKANQPIPWNPRWDAGDMPALSRTLWVCMDSLGARSSDLFGGADKGPPQFMALRNEYVHGLRPADPASFKITAEADVVARTALRIVHGLLHLPAPNPTTRGRQVWYLESSHTRYSRLPEEWIHQF